MSAESPYTLTLQSRQADGSTVIDTNGFLVNGVFRDFRIEGELTEYVGGKIDAGATLQRAVYRVVFSNFYVVTGTGITQKTEEYETLMEMLRQPRLYIQSCDLVRSTRVYSADFPVEVQCTSISATTDFANANDKVTAEFSTVTRAS